GPPAPPGQGPGPSRPTAWHEPSVADTPATPEPVQTSITTPVRRNQSICWRTRGSRLGVSWGSLAARLGVLSSGGAGTPESHSMSAEPAQGWLCRTHPHGAERVADQ